MPIIIIEDGDSLTETDEVNLEAEYDEYLSHAPSPLLTFSEWLAIQ
jgi:hypothetical protein